MKIVKGINIDLETYETLKRLAGDVPLTRYLKRLIKEKADTVLAKEELAE